MIKTFRFNTGAIDILYDRGDDATNKICPRPLWGKAKRVLTYLNEPGCIEKFRSIPNAHLEKMTKEKALLGFWSVRIDRQYRVLFKYDKATDSVSEVFIADYH
jgi:plasmid maintenance system killer protein